MREWRSKSSLERIRPLKPEIMKKLGELQEGLLIDKNNCVVVYIHTCFGLHSTEYPHPIEAERFVKNAIISSNLFNQKEKLRAGGEIGIRARLRT